MSDQLSKVEADRKLLRDAQEQGTGAVLSAFVRLSGPGWLQSAITLGGGSLAGALFLGVLGGTSLLWLQLMAIAMGVVMLSAISYVTLSTGEKPFQAINSHINPALGWGWLIATCMANMIWCMPQFGLCYAALKENLVGESIGDSSQAKLMVSAVMLAAAGFVVLLNQRRGLGAKIFDIFLKALVGMIVICFFGVVVYLGANGHLNWGAIFAGFVPDVKQWNGPTGDLAALVSSLPASLQEFWSAKIIKEQRAIMIASAATAVGINMTFLLPYSMLNRGWDKPFRGLARFDLSTGMAIPYILVTSCVVIASAASFHATIDEPFKSSDPAVMTTSEFFDGAKPFLVARVEHEMGAEAFGALSGDEQLAKIAALPESEKRIASSLVRRNAFQLSKALAPLLGEQNANLVFGIGICGMGFSTIIILMLINGYAFCEMLGKPQGGTPYVIGCLVSGLCGAAWPLIWDGPAKLWLAILTSTFGMMLLPIAYVTFFMMMNSKTLMGKEKPTGGSMITWNVLMGISVIGAIVAAGAAVWEKISPILDAGAAPNDVLVGWVVAGVAGVYIVLVVAGFIAKSKQSAA
ncbi:MAG: divalent metal cation transporter [Planctomycetaceae bacterium]|nr:divalent metal cation transporter [Planctomycetaceae bacterium]MCB9940786.1 divalent metal cation transporter [Planctomycetaceae bacterium]